MGNARRTCRREVAVSVRTPPRELRWASGVARAERRVEAGREKREIERANTIVNDLHRNEGAGQLKVPSEMNEIGSGGF